MLNATEPPSYISLAPTGLLGVSNSGDAESRLTDAIAVSSTNQQPESTTGSSMLKAAAVTLYLTGTASFDVSNSDNACTRTAGFTYSLPGATTEQISPADAESRMPHWHFRREIAVL